MRNQTLFHVCDFSLQFIVRLEFALVKTILKKKNETAYVVRTKKTNDEVSARP